MIILKLINQETLELMVFKLLKTIGLLIALITLIIKLVPSQPLKVLIHFLIEIKDAIVMNKIKLFLLV